MRRSRATVHLLFAGAFLLAATTSYAAGAPAPATTVKDEILFISTNPMGAVVVLDGKTLPRTTPVLLRDVKPGKHRLAITKQGYRTVREDFEAAAGRVTAIKVNLAENFISPVLPKNEELAFKGRLYPYSSEYYEIPTGTYSISRKGDTVAFTPIFPGQNALSFFNVATPMLLGASAAATISTLFSSSSHPDWGVPVLSYFASALSIAVDISLHLQKDRYVNSFAITPVPRAVATVAQRYEKANELLAQGDLADAVDQYIAVVEQPQDSIDYPLALYQLGRIHVIQGDLMLAISELRLIIDKYPIPEVYDKACKSLADIADQQGDYRAALGYLGQMVFYDPLYPKGQIEQYRAAIEAQEGRSGK